MTEKLVWDYDQSSGEQHAIVKRDHQTYRIRAVHDDDAQNPFTDGDCNWPIVVRSPDAFSPHDHKCYYFGEEHSSGSGHTLTCQMFSDQALIHSQIHIAKALGWDGIPQIMEVYSTDHEYAGEKYLPYSSYNAEMLRDAFDQSLGDNSVSRMFAEYEELLKIADIPCYRTTVTGYSQGDWAEVIVIATPEAVEKFGCTEPPKPEDLETTAKLYGWWAYGDCYGHIVERRCVGDSFDDDDGTDEEWEELDDGACWSFYGPDHDQSGLEESALGSIPDEIMREAA